MKLLALLAIALSLLSAGPAEARHHHRSWQAQHSAVPMPRERPAPVRLERAPLHSYAVAWWPSTSPWRADEAFSRAAWVVAAQWQEVRR